MSLMKVGLEIIPSTSTPRRVLRMIFFLSYITEMNLSQVRR
jgi:hypothetical protein